MRRELFKKNKFPHLMWDNFAPELIMKRARHSDNDL